MLSQICLSVCLSVTRLDQSKTVEVRIMQFSPYSSPIPLILQDRFHPEIPRDPPSPASNKGRLGETYYFRSSNAFTRWLHKLELLSQLRCLDFKIIRQVAALLRANHGVSWAFLYTSPLTFIYSRNVYNFKVKSPCTCYNVTHTQSQQRFNIQEVAADWHKLG